jgi:hypothetical protein
MRARLLALAVVLGCGHSASPPAVSELSSRSVSAPVQLGWVSSLAPSGDLPSAIALGGKASGRVLVYLEFLPEGDPKRLLRAELLLDTLPGADTVEVELSRAEAARGELRSWSDQPRARDPRLGARLSSSGVPQRLDVTELVRAQSKPDEPLRLLLRAEPGDGAPVLVQTGAAGGVAPKLEQYWE